MSRQTCYAESLAEEFLSDEINVGPYQRRLKSLSKRQEKRKEKDGRNRNPMRKMI